MLRRRKGTVFPHLVSQAAFVDTIVLSIYGEGRPRTADLVNPKSRAILVGKSKYARQLEATWNLTGNPIEIKYGKVSRYPAVPPIQMRVRSESIPLTGAQVTKLVKSVFPHAREVRISSVELTFDCAGMSFSRICETVEHRAQERRRKGSRRGWRTLYVGSPRSFWFAKIYEKAKGILRFEFTFNRSYLTAKGMIRPNDLVALRNIRLRSLLSVREFSRARLAAATQEWNATMREVLWDWTPKQRGLQKLREILAMNGLQISKVLRGSKEQRQLEAMLRLLVW